MRFTRTVSRVRGVDFSLMIAHTSTPASSIHITYLATFNVGGTAGRKAIDMDSFRSFSDIEISSSYVQGVSHTTAGACSIQVFFDRTTKQVNVSGAIDIATAKYALLHLDRITLTAAIGIVPHGGTFFDMDISIILASQTGSMNQSLMFQTALYIPRHAKVKCWILLLPLK